MRGLHPTAAATIEQITAQGITLAPADVVRINDLAHQIETPEVRRHLAKGAPVKLCAGVWLWPQTIAGWHWYINVGELLEHGEDDQIPLAYALAHGHSDISTHGAAEVKAWSRKLTCTATELSVAVCQVLEQSHRDRVDYSTGGKRYSDVGELAIHMARNYGGTIEHWQYAVSIECIRDMIFISEMQEQAGLSFGDAVQRDARLMFTATIAEIIERHQNGAKQ